MGEGAGKLFPQWCGCLLYGDDLHPRVGGDLVHAVDAEGFPVVEAEEGEDVVVGQAALRGLRLEDRGLVVGG